MEDTETQYVYYIGDDTMYVEYSVNSYKIGKQFEELVYRCDELSKITNQKIKIDIDDRYEGHIQNVPEYIYYTDGTNYFLLNYDCKINLSDMGYYIDEDGVILQTNIHSREILREVVDKMFEMIATNNHSVYGDMFDNMSTYEIDKHTVYNSKYPMFNLRPNSEIANTLTYKIRIKLHNKIETMRRRNMMRTFMQGKLTSENPIGMIDELVCKKIARHVMS